VHGIGQTLNDKLKSAIKASDAVVVLLTENASSSLIISAEIGYAIGKSKRIVPLVAPVVANDSSTLGMLNGLEYIPLDKSDPQEGLLKLTDVVNNLMRVQGGELHRAERETHSIQLANRDATLVQLQSRYDVAMALLIFAGAIGVVAVMSRST